MMSINGIEIRVNPCFTKSSTRTRTWKERWLSRPWLPFQRLVTIQVPDPSAYQIGGILYMHPVTFARMRAQLELDAFKEPISSVEWAAWPR